MNGTNGIVYVGTVENVMGGVNTIHAQGHNLRDAAEYMAGTFGQYVDTRGKIKLTHASGDAQVAMVLLSPEVMLTVERA